MSIDPIGSMLGLLSAAADVAGGPQARGARRRRHLRPGAGRVPQASASASAFPGGDLRPDRSGGRDDHQRPPRTRRGARPATHGWAELRSPTKTTRLSRRRVRADSAAPESTRTCSCLAITAIPRRRCRASAICGSTPAISAGRCGGYLYFVGRQAHWIRRGGENISAYEIETSLPQCRHRRGRRGRRALGIRRGRHQGVHHRRRQRSARPARRHRLVPREDGAFKVPRLSSSSPTSRAR